MIKKISSGIIDLVKSYIKNFAEHIYKIRNIHQPYRGIGLRHFEKNIFPKITIDIKKKCLNQDQVKDIPDEDLIYYKEGENTYCLPIKQIYELFKKDNFINPYTNNPLTIEFIEFFKKTYTVKEKIIIEAIDNEEYDNTELAPGLLDIIYRDIEKIVDNEKENVNIWELEDNLTPEGQKISSIDIQNMEKIKRRLSDIKQNFVILLEKENKNNSTLLSYCMIL